MEFLTSLSVEYVLYKNGVELTVQQQERDGVYGKNNVPMSIFYEDSELQLYNTSYLMQFYSDDNGVTWHKDKIISGMTKPENSKYFITGPGKGIQINNGNNAGRIIIPIYCQLSGVSNIGTPTTGVIYSDDGGENWIDVKSLFGDNSQGTNCQVSAINLSTLLEDPEEPDSKYPAVAMASANTKARKNGKIWIGLIKESGQYEDGSIKYDIDWEYDYDVTGISELFAYSCMAELANGDIGMLYESSPNDLWSTGLQAMYYKEFSLDEILSVD